MKFVERNAIAGIFVLAVGVVGGLVIAVKPPEYVVDERVQAMREKCKPKDGLRDGAMLDPIAAQLVSAAISEVIEMIGSSATPGSTASAFSILPMTNRTRLGRSPGLPSACSVPLGDTKKEPRDG